VWTKSNDLLYYNNNSNYAVANETNKQPFEVELGNGTSNQKTEVWDEHEVVLHFNEGTGTTVSDSTVNGHNTSLSDSALWTNSGKFGEGVGDFKQHSAYVNLAKEYSSFLDGSNDFSIELWIYPEDSTPPAYEMVLDLRGERGIQWYIDDSPAGELNCFIKLGGTWYHITSTNLSFNSWNHIVFVYDASTGSELFVNGYSEDTDSHQGTIASLSGTHNTIGCHNEVQDFFNGSIDEFRIWNKSLSSTEIKAHYRQGVSLGAEETSNHAPTTPTPSITPAPVYTNTSPVNCSATVTDPDGDNMNATFILYNGSNVIKTCAFTNKTNGTTLNCGMTNTSKWAKGNTINCTVTVTDNNSRTSTGSATKTVGDLAPDQPALNSPQDGCTGVLSSTLLNVTVADLDDDSLDVTFLNALDNSVICSNLSISSGSTVGCRWSNLSPGATYRWFVNITEIPADGTAFTTGPRWNFSTNHG